MSEAQMRSFEQVSLYCEEHSSLLPLSFVLSFYVSAVVTRWWAQWNAIPWPDNLAMVVNTYCPGTVRSPLTYPTAGWQVWFGHSFFAADVVRLKVNHNYQQSFMRVNVNKM